MDPGALSLAIETSACLLALLAGASIPAIVQKLRARHTLHLLRREVGHEAAARINGKLKTLTE